MKPTIHVYTIMLDWSFEKYIASVLTFDDLQNKVSQTEVNFKLSTYPKPLIFGVGHGKTVPKSTLD